MVKRRRYSSRPTSDAAANARDLYIQEQFNADTARGSKDSITKYGMTWALADSKQKYARYLAGFRGRGDYKSALAWGSRGLGGAVGGYFGGARGAAQGYGWGGRFSKWMGWGKYKRRRKNYRGRGDYAGDAGGNQIMGGSVATPITVNASDDLSGDIYISHREFLGDVTALATGTSTPSAFNNLIYDLNVGLQTTFPWVSQIAQNFTLYELEGCIFEYKPNSGELGSASNALGKVIMATQYDPDAPMFGTAVEMENYSYSTSCKPSEHMLHGIETDPKQRSTQMLYVRTGPASKDKVFTDYGRFQIATQGLPVNATAGTIVNIGELWVTYRVKLSRAQLYNSLLSADVGFDQFVGVSNATKLFGNTTFIATTAYAGLYNISVDSNKASPRLTNSIGCTTNSTTLNGIDIAFPSNIVQGTYRVSIWISQSAAAAKSFFNPTGLNYCTLAVPKGIVDPVASTGSIIDTPAGATTFALACEFYIKVNAPGNLVAGFSIATSSAIASGAVISITVHEVPGKLLL